MSKMSNDYLLFRQFLVQKALNAKPEDAPRYALGAVTVDLMVDQHLFAEFLTYRKTQSPIDSSFNSSLDKITPEEVEKMPAEMARQSLFELGFISETCAQSGKFVCRATFPPPTTFPPPVHTGSIICLSKEIEGHVSLGMNACVMASLGGAEQRYEAGDAEFLKNFHDKQKQCARIKRTIFQELNKEILLAQLSFLYQGTTGEKPSANLVQEWSVQSSHDLSLQADTFYIRYIQQYSEVGHRAFNRFQANMRIDLANKYRDLAFQRMQIEGILPSDHEAVMKQLKKVPASYDDEIQQNSATGSLSSRNTTPYTAHDKQLSNNEGKTSLAAMRLVLGDGTVLWRAPSIAATDAHEKGITGDYVEDVKRKLLYLSGEIVKREHGGNPDDLVYYNLLTTPHGLKDNNQTWSTIQIMQGVHACNREKLRNDTSGKNLVMLCNIPVNQFGTIDPEARMLANLAISQLIGHALQTQKIDLGPNQQAVLEIIKKQMEIYITFLSSNATMLVNTTAGKELSNNQAELIASLEKITLKTHQMSNESLALLCVIKMFKTGTYENPQHGMLIQALLCAVEENKFAGCKSANERFASVLAKSIFVKSKDFSTLMTRYINGKINEDALYSGLLDIYNTQGVYEDIGQACSIADQGGGPKTDKFDTADTPPSTAIIASQKYSANEPSNHSSSEYQVDLYSNLFEMLEKYLHKKGETLSEGTSSASENSNVKLNFNAVKQYAKSAARSMVGIERGLDKVSIARKIYADVTHLKAILSKESILSDNDAEALKSTRNELALIYSEVLDAKTNGISTDLDELLVQAIALYDRALNTEDAELIYYQPKPGSHVSVAMNTNKFESPQLTHLDQTGSSDLQAHKSKANVEQSLRKAASFGTRISKTIQEAESYNVQNPYHEDVKSSFNWKLLRTSSAFSKRLSQGPDLASSSSQSLQSGKERTTEQSFEHLTAILNSLRFIEKTVERGYSPETDEESIHSNYVELINLRDKHLNTKADPKIRTLVDKSIALHEEMLELKRPNFDKYPHHASLDQDQKSQQKHHLE